MQLVIGSGPAGTAAAAALLELGLSVTMLDAGGTLEPQIAARVADMRQRLPDSWTDAERASLYGPLRYNAEGAPLKLAFGSDYVYRDVDRWQPVDARNVDTYRSLATGGMSALWGAAIMPFSEADFSDWPIGVREMKDHYAAVLRLTGLAAQHDALETLYPLHIEPTAGFPLGAQAGSVLARAGRHRPALDRQRIYVGRARLAFRSGSGAADACARCGMCLYGCPYGIIYSTERTVEELLAGRADRFTYVSGVVVRRVAETAAGVAIDGVDRATGALRRFEGKRVYLGAGVLPSTTILLRSLDRPASVVLRQSDHFLLPVLLTAASGRSSTERLHTLSQLFIEVLDPAVSPRGVHLQLYTYNDLYERMARERLGALYQLAAPIAARLIDRIALVKGYLHSDESDGIDAALETRGDADVLRLEAIRNAEATHTIRKVTNVIRRNTTRLGLWPLRFALRKGLPGSSVHVGGSFPMRREPAGLESDILGRPAGLSRVHAIDASVFPTMPAASPTLTIMANARRIAIASQQGVDGST